ncbi:MAG: carboxypeptidase regulatory-like domain-containing protein [Bryobacteraceae bacterium]
MCHARIVSLLSFLFALVLSAQSPTATLVGTVEDTTGARIGDADIQVRNIDMGDARTASSKADGQFTIPNLAPGKYEVTIAKPGFRTMRQTGLELQVDEAARLDAKLQVGPLTESVEVRADVPLVNTENATRGDVITSHELTEMPLDGPDFTDLAFLVVGVQHAEQGQKGAGFSINGSRADSSNVIVDGFNDQNPRDAGAQARPPLDALEEFKMQTSGYSAEYGRQAGGVMNMVLKSGGNQ